MSEGVTGVLEWMTFAAAALAAIGTFAGPLIAYRSAMRTIAANQESVRAAAQQTRVDRYVGQAVGHNPVAASFALAQLDYVLSTGELTVEQTRAVQNAIRAAVERLRARVENSPQLDLVEDDGRSGSANPGGSGDVPPGIDTAQGDRRGNG
jgi:hypothetical protein